jgi:hypothetical protein
VVGEPLLKGRDGTSETGSVQRVFGLSSKVITGVVGLVVLGAALAGASVVDANIGDPLAFQRENGTITQVLPIVPTTAPPAPATFDVASAVRTNAHGTASEARPHGVPTSWDWGGAAIVRGITPPSYDSRFMNLWGQVYTDAANTHPANTRVTIAGCELWRLPATGTTWTRVQGSAGSRIEGGAWAEDYSRNDGTFDIRRESDGSYSTVPPNGYNAHFWTTDPLADAGTGARGYVAACSTRLVLANPAGVDDRAQSGYVISVGVDWRQSNYGCPVVNGITVCNGLGVGRFIRVTNQWRRVVFSTIPASSSLPLPPADAFRNPDGTFGA